MSTPEQRAEWADAYSWLTKPNTLPWSRSSALVEDSSGHSLFATASHIAAFCVAATIAVPALLADVERLESENARLRAELRRWLEEIAGTPPEALWEMEEPCLDYVTIQVDKKDYLEARAALEAMGEK